MRAMLVLVFLGACVDIELPTGATVGRVYACEVVLECPGLEPETWTAQHCGDADDWNPADVEADECADPKCPGARCTVSCAGTVEACTFRHGM